MIKHAVHLARRFGGSLWPAGPPGADEAWATHHMVEGEVALWQRMKGYDRRHAVGVARRVAVALGPAVTRPVMAAALLHDVGKIDSDLGVMRRVAATLWAGVRGRQRVASGEGRTARYLNHPEIGAQLLRDAGADSLTAAWAAEHHFPSNAWTIDETIAGALKDADDD